MVDNGKKQADAGQQQAAQMVYLAQLNASKSGCKCEACQLLRKGVDAMTQAVLNPQSGGADQLLASLKQATAGGVEDGEAVEV
jgi:hypothetical protein